MLAGDDDLGTVTTLLALTPTDGGQMRIDPVPLPPRSDRDAFAYGYGGGTPATTYRALLRCALAAPPTSCGLTDWPQNGTQTGIRSASCGLRSPQLRLSWPQVKLWARADKNHALANPDTTQ